MNSSSTKQGLLERLAQIAMNILFSPRCHIKGSLLKSTDLKSGETWRCPNEFIESKKLLKSCSKSVRKPRKSTKTSYWSIKKLLL